MKKYLWLIAGIAVSIVSSLVFINMSAKPMTEDCLPDGSCCEDENACTCG